MNYPNQLLLIEEYKYALNKNQHQAVLIERIAGNGGDNDKNKTMAEQEHERPNKNHQLLILLCGIL